MSIGTRRTGFTNLVVDVALCLGLIVALIVVIGADRIFSVAPAPDKRGEIEVVIAEEDKPVAKPLSLGVTPEHAEFDDMGSLLTQLGEGYKYQAFPLDDLIDVTKLKRFDIIFLTCSGMTPLWLTEATGKVSERGNKIYAPNQETFALAKRALREFVGGGGTLYASDLHFDLISEVFPEFVDSRMVNTGTPQTVEAEVIDDGLREFLGTSTIELKFDQPGWYPAAFNLKNGTAFLRGTYQPRRGSPQSAPLLVKFPFSDKNQLVDSKRVNDNSNTNEEQEEGHVIFTSFHNERLTSATAEKLLKYLVFATITAKVDAQVTKTMMKGGFAPAKRNLFSTSGNQRSVSQVYQCTKSGDLQFVLAFAQQGDTHLKLTVTGPDGKSQEKQGKATLTIDVPKAAVGAWNYTVTAIHAPNDNFTFTVTVGQK